jgi:hypothetical protein
MTRWGKCGFHLTPAQPAAIDVKPILDPSPTHAASDLTAPTPEGKKPIPLAALNLKSTDRRRIGGG